MLLILVHVRISDSIIDLFIAVFQISNQASYLKFRSQISDLNVKFSETCDLRTTIDLPVLVYNFLFKILRSLC